jgi:2-deoxy-D-gluconate 3-dehydrogenase
VLWDGRVLPRYGITSDHGDEALSTLFDLSGKTAIVTGANTGIGQGIAVALAGAGARIGGVGRSPMDDTRRRIEEGGGSFHAITADLASIEPTQRIIDETIAWSGRADILVNNAGIIRRADPLDFTEKDWDDVINVNLKSYFFLSQVFARRVLEQGGGGKIINVASILSFQGGIRIPSYTASKGGVAGITRLLANEWAAKGINVNAIAPGYTVSNNTQAIRDDPDRNAAILARIPAGRWGTPEDMGGAAVFLAARASDYCHGTILVVDGGWLAR